MERNYRGGERRRGDKCDHKPRYDRDRDRDRSRSPPNRERRDDRRRDRSPYRGPQRGGRGGGRGGSQYQDRDRDFQRGRQTSGTPPPSRRPDNRGPLPRQAPDDRLNGAAPKGPKQASAPDVNMEGLEGEDEDATMQRVLGFRNFRTTKDTKVPGNDKNYAVFKVKKAEYRQYMNRVGGFNRPLSPSRL
ncbi:hypothetical protein LTR85_008095 [Meristemomyces frigidus]|nr:hypothetical protein LTR85_008095 [Meristemomyces frigidus]